MRRFRHQAGYTIVEVMFFLIISAGLFGAAVVGISDQNRRTQFTNEVDRLQNRLQDALNDVSVGYYPSDLRVKCEVNNPADPLAEPVLSKLADGDDPVQGKNQDCIFVGKVIQFRTENAQTNFISYTLVGKRAVGTGNDERQVASLAEAVPRALGVLDRGGVLENERLNAGLVINRVVSISDPDETISSIAVISDFGKTATIGKAVTGTASRVTLGVVRDTALTMDTNAFVNRLEEPDMIDLAYAGDASSFAREGIILCLEEAGGGRRASITIGGNNQQLSLERTIDTWPPRCDP